MGSWKRFIRVSPKHAPGRLLYSWSVRSVIAGSMRAARQAGSSDATPDPMSSSSSSTPVRRERDAYRAGTRTDFERP